MNPYEGSTEHSFSEGTSLEGPFGYPLMASKVRFVVTDPEARAILRYLLVVNFGRPHGQMRPRCPNVIQPSSDSPFALFYPASREHPRYRVFPAGSS